MKQKLYSKFVPEATKNWDEHLINIKEEYQFKFDEKNIKDFVENNIAMKKTKSLSKKDFNDKQLSLVLTSWENGGFSVADLLTRYGNNVSRFTDSTKTRDDINKLANHFFVADIAERLGLIEDEKSQKLLKEILERSLLKKAQETVKDKIEIDENELKRYYNKNIQEFSTPEKMEIWQIFVTAKEKADRVFNLAKKGNNFEQLAKSYSEDKRVARRGGKLGLLSLRSSDIVTLNAF